jgi:dephospho-CoA kinase
MIILGVTGGIGSGKSLVCRMLEERGATVFSADDVAKELMVQDAGIRDRIVDIVGAEAYTRDGRLDRAFVASAIFSSDEKRRAIEAVVHPAVSTQFFEASVVARSQGCNIFVREAALMPVGARHQLNHVAVVTAPREDRIRRVRLRDGANEDSVLSRIENQMSEAEYLALADTVLTNDGSIENLQTQVDILISQLLLRVGPTRDPEIGASVPRKRGWLSTQLARWVYFGTGWRFEGSLPDLPHFVVVGAPHTSNWDFVFAMLAIHALRLDVKWIGKHTLFRPPLGVLLRKMGGTPVNRTDPGGIVDQVLNLFEKEERFVFGLAPEGTRKRVDQWKTGFHRIARAAGVPIVPGYLDFGRNIIGFGPPLYPGPDAEADIAVLKDFYSHFQGKNPDLAG